MPRRIAVALAGCAAFGLLGAASANAASFDCKGRSLSAAQITICADQELSLADDRVARRVRDMQKRHGLGLYLGLRYWTIRNQEVRDACERDRACLVTTYRTKQRLLERLQTCLDSSIRKRSCLRAAVSNEETAAQGGAPPGGRAR